MRAFLVSCVVCLMPLAVWAQGPMPLDVVTLTFSYTEPTTNTDDSMLTDLASCTIIWDVNGAGQPDIVTAASTPAGGGVMDRTLETAFNRTADRVVTAETFCTDATGNDSAKTMSVSLVVPHVPAVPQAPMGLGVTYE